MTIDKIFSLRNNEIKPLPSRSFREGLLGSNLEAGLQNLVEHYPEILSGSQVKPGGEEPPRFALLCSEIAINNWFLDSLLVDQDGVLTLVESKLVENPESRRAVVGQIIEYAAYASQAWAHGNLREQVSTYWHKRGRDAESAIFSLFDGPIDLDWFWSRVEENLAQNKLRLILATDKLRPSVRRIVEFLNGELRNVEILALELTFYGEDADSVVVVPRIVGQTQATAGKGTYSRTQGPWSDERLKEVFSSYRDEVLGQRLVTVLEWASRTGLFIESSNQTPSFGIMGPCQRRIMSVWDTGIVYCYLHAERHGNNEHQRRSFIAGLNSFSIFNFPFEGIVSGRDSVGSLVP